MKALLVVLPLALGACGVVRGDQVSKMGGPELTSVSDRDICNPLVNSRGAAVERQKRGLGDCTPAHRSCVQTGFQAGTQGYLQCRQIAAQKEASERAAWAGVAATGFQMMATPPPRPTVNCTSSSVGGAVFTNCY